MTGAPPPPEIPARLAVRDVMARAPATLRAAAPLAEVVARLLESGRRALPVVAGGRPVGMVTQGDLLARGALALRLEVLARLDEADRAEWLAALASDARTAASLMTPDPITIPEAAPLREAAERMARHGLKRLPALDGAGKLSGVVSRVDVLRAVVGGPAEPEDPPPSGLAAGAPVSSAMRRDVPALDAATPRDEAARAVLGTRSNRALVVDGAGRPVGVLGDAELLEALAPPLRRGLFSSRVDRLAFAHSARDAAERHATARTAGDLAVPVATARADLPLRDAIAVVLSGPHRLLAVVGPDGRLEGALDRADLLRALLGGAPPAPAP